MSSAKSARRRSDNNDQIDIIPALHPSQRVPHDIKVTFEEYHYYAQKTRAEENASLNSDLEKRSVFDTILGRKKETNALPSADGNTVDVSEKITEEEQFAVHLHIDDSEWNNASRLMRTATAGSCFYLITTDILGPYGVGFALGTLGWGPGIVLYTVFGVLAGYSGYLLWKTFLGLDSYEYPVMNYGDLAFRIFGPIPRHLINLLQGILLICILGQVTIQNGQGLSQVSRFRLCYAVCPVIFIGFGFFLGQVRTLKKFGWLASAAVFLNLMVMFITMGVMAHSPPNYQISVLGSAGSAVDPTTITPDAAGNYPPVRHYNGLPDPNSLIGSFNGLMQAVFAYGGAQLFVEFMAEMRRPHDFIKGMWAAQFFIWSVYLIYGCYVYYWQGQYSYQISYQGVSTYGWQTAGNMIAVLSGLIAAGLYGNIGIKVLYNNLLVDLFHVPPLTTRRGKIMWIVLVPVWWSVAYIIAGAIPDYFGFVSIISAICVVQFSYSFPPILVLGYDMQIAAMKGEEAFDPATGRATRTARGLKRWIKAFVAGRWYINIWYVIYAGGSLAVAGLGAYAAITGMIDAFKNPQVNSFSCRSPLDLSAA